MKKLLLLFLIMNFSWHVNAIQEANFVGAVKFVDYILQSDYRTLVLVPVALMPAVIISLLYVPEEACCRRRRRLPGLPA